MAVTAAGLSTRIRPWLSARITDPNRPRSAAKNSASCRFWWVASGSRPLSGALTRVLLPLCPILMAGLYHQALLSGGQLDGAKPGEGDRLIRHVAQAVLVA